MSSENTALDLIAVEAYLRAHLPNFAGPSSAVKFETGQSNPTFLLKTPARNYVLRRKPMGVLLKSAHAVEREFRIQKALIASNVPVAGMHLLCEDEDIIGSSFYIMDHVVGRNFVEPTLRGLDGSERIQVFENMGEVLADLHMVDINAVGLSDYGPAGNYFERQLARWTKQYRSTETERIPEMDTLIKELQSTLPLDDGQRSLVHGDYRIDNLIFQNNGTQCLAVLDWELSTIGHPYSDLAGVIMQWQMPQGPEGRGLLGVDREVNNIPSDQEFMDMYCAHRGLPGIESFEFYLAFSFFRMAGILQGVLKRAMSGNASNPERAKKLGQYVPLFARHGLDALSR